MKSDAEKASGTAIQEGGRSTHSNSIMEFGIGHE